VRSADPEPGCEYHPALIPDRRPSAPPGGGAGRGDLGAARDLFFLAGAPGHGPGGRKSSPFDVTARFSVACAALSDGPQLNAFVRLVSYAAPQAHHIDDRLFGNPYGRSSGLPFGFILCESSVRKRTAVVRPFSVGITRIQLPDPGSRGVHATTASF
jgi:hypothetical protein